MSDNSILRSVLIDIFSNHEDTRRLIDNEDLFSEVNEILNESKIDYYLPFAYYLEKECHIRPSLILQIIKQLCFKPESSKFLGEGIWKLLLHFKICECLDVLRMSCQKQRENIACAISTFNFSHGSLTQLIDKCCVMIGEVVSKQEVEEIVASVTDNRRDFELLFTERKVTDFTVGVFGSSCVGKSCFLTRYVQHSYKEVGPNAGFDYKIKYIDVDETRVKLQLYDTVGQERFNSLTASFYRKCQGIILVYDITQQSSFDSLKRYLTDIEKYHDLKKVDLIIVGNKSDLEQQRQVAMIDVAQFSRDNQIEFMEISVKENKFVTHAFRSLIKKMLGRDRKKEKKESPSPSIIITSLIEGNKKCCLS